MVTEAPRGIRVILDLKPPSGDTTGSFPLEALIAIGREAMAILPGWTVTDCVVGALPRSSVT